ncbi:MAG: hypothetical protein H8F28_13440 [Fibrella sp.]|nr:hypothetical protein [Armatimonadota bacterium]
MTSTRIIFKPAGVIALLLLSAIVVTVFIFSLQGRSKNSAAVGKVSSTRNTNGVQEPMQDELRLVRLNETPGQSRDWLFLGPLPSGSTIPDGAMTEENKARMRQIIATSYLPTEAKYKARADVPVTVNKVTYRWRKVTGSAFNFVEMFAQGSQTPPLTNVVVYGYTTIESKSATRKRLRFRSDDGAIVWINGQQVYMGNEIRGVDIEDVIPIDLRPGQNNVLVKIGQGTNGWGMSFHLEPML